MNSLQSKRVLIVGGSSGISAAAAKAFAALGAQVTIASRNAQKLADAAARIGHGVRTARSTRPTPPPSMRFSAGSNRSIMW